MYPFTAPIKANGKIIAELDCELEIDAEISEADFILTVMRVEVEGVDLLSADTSCAVAMGREIASLAERDEILLEKVMIAEGVSYVGLGGNDPDGRLVRRAA